MLCCYTTSDKLNSIFTWMQDFFLKFGAQICEVILNSLMKRLTTLHQSSLLWTRSCRAKPWPALPNCHVKSPLFWDIMQHWEIILYQCFGTTCLSHFPGSESLKERTEHDWSWLTQSSFLGGLVHHLLFKKHSVLEVSSVSVFRQRST